MTEENLNKPSHITYKEYQKKINKKSNDGIAIFVSAFFILLLLFLGIAKQISPDVDVSIGDSNSNSETVGIEKTNVDERLKLLQMEDAGENIFSPELDEKVVIPERDTEKEKAQEVVKQPETSETPKAPEKVQSDLTAKVVVGYYSSKEQADVAKDIIAESGLNITPFVRSIGGNYTIQVGSYASREKAQAVVNDLLRNNYPARIIME